MSEAKALNAWHTVHTRCFLKDTKGPFWIKGPEKAVEGTALKLPSRRISSDSHVGRAFPAKGGIWNRMCSGNGV